MQSDKYFLIVGLENNPYVETNNNQYFDVPGLSKFIREKELEPEAYLFYRLPDERDTIKLIKASSKRDLERVGEEADEDEAYFLVVGFDSIPKVVLNKNGTIRKFHFGDAYWYCKDNDIKDGTFQIGIYGERVWMDFEHALEWLNWKELIAA